MCVYMLCMSGHGIMYVVYVARLLFSSPLILLARYNPCVDFVPRRAVNPQFEKNCIAVYT